MSISPNSPQSPADIVNRAIVLMGGFDSNTPLTGTPETNFNGTPLGIAAAVIYGDVVQTVGKQFGWDFSRNVVTLVGTGNPPPFNFAFEYLYPTSGIQVRQIMLPMNDPFNPIPVTWTIGNTTIAGIVTKVIWTSAAAALAVITGQPQESLWDPLFVEAVVRGIASALGMGAAGRPETAQLELERSGAILAVGKTKQG
jgi:hypothetical protein